MNTDLATESGAPLVPMNKKIRITISGIGNRALPKKPQDSNWLGWVELIKRSQYFQLVAAHDVSKEPIKRIVECGYLKPKQTYCDLDLMLKEVACDAILVSNPGPCHANTIKKALDFDLHLLIEKPFVHEVQEGKRLINLIEKKKRVACVVQNWRCKDVGRLLYQTIQGGMLGKVGHVFFRYIRNRENPNYPPYIFQEKHPLLYSMGIHHFDLLRYILRDEFESVSAHSFKPPWSRYASDTGVNLLLRTSQGVTVVYSGTISSRNKCIPQESLIIEGEKGTLINESQWLEPPLWFHPADKNESLELSAKIRKMSITEQYNIADTCILNNFYRAITQKEKPICSVRDGLQSVAVVEVSRLACEKGKTIFLKKCQ